MRGGVPVLSSAERETQSPEVLAELEAACSPIRPPCVCCSPQCIRPRRNVPVVRMTASAAQLATVLQATPVTDAGSPLTDRVGRDPS